MPSATIEAPTLPQLTFDDIAPSPPPVAILADYTLGANIAPGIWLARQPDDTAPRAIARVFDPESINRRTLERFAHDALQLRRIDHPGAARILAAGIVGLPNGPAPYLVEELVTGTPLIAHAKDMGLRGKLYLLAALADALHAAHLKGVAHRDLSPERLIVEDCGRLRVRALGVSHITNDDVRAFSARMNASASRVTHLAPEQAIGAYAAIDARADVYSLGVIGYQLLTGRPPYTLTGSAKEAASIIKTETPAPADLGTEPLAKDAETILLKALRKRPEARHQSASEFARDLTCALAGEPHSARTAGARQHLRLAARRRPILTTAAAAALLLTTVGAAMLGFSVAPTPRHELQLAEPAPINTSTPRVTLVAHQLPARTDRMNAAARLNRATALATTGKPNVAETVLKDLIQKAQSAEERSAAQRALAELYADQGRHTDAEPLALEALTRTVDELGPDSVSARECYQTLSKVLAVTSRQDQANQWWSLLAGVPAAF